jgi:excisionase family DNA binding protein
MTTDSARTELYTVPEAAKRLKVSSKTLRRFIDRREIEVVRVGRALRVSGAAIDAFVSKHTVPVVTLAVVNGRVLVTKEK